MKEYKQAKKNKIAILGCGVGGTVAFCHLVAESAKKGLTPSITVIEKSGNFGSGEPYGTENPECFINNHENWNMGSVNDDPLDFFHWMQENSKSLTEKFPNSKDEISNKNGYAPREAYGMYLKNRFEEALQLAQESGIKTKLETRNIDNPHIYATAFDHVIISFGSEQKAGDSNFSENGNYFSSAYPSDIYTKNMPGKSVLIRGTGLSAVDAAIAAIELGGAEKVYMCSRRGQLRFVRGNYDKSYIRKHLTIENLEQMSGKENPFKINDVLSLLEKEMDEYYGHKINWQDVYYPKDMRKQLEENIAQAKSGEELKWRTVLLSLGEDRQKIYDRLAPEDKKVFMENYYTLFLSYQAPMPLKNAEKIYEYMQAGKLEVIGGIQNIFWDNGQNSFVVTHTHGSEGRPLHPNSHDVKINAVERQIKGGILIDAIGALVTTLDIDLESKKLAGKGNIFYVGAMQFGTRIPSPNSIVTANDAKAVVGQIINEISLNKQLGVL